MEISFTSFTSFTDGESAESHPWPESWLQESTRMKSLTELLDDVIRRGVPNCRFPAEDEALVIAALRAIADEQPSLPTLTCRAMNTPPVGKKIALDIGKPEPLYTAVRIAKWLPQIFAGDRLNLSTVTTPAALRTQLHRLRQQLFQRGADELREALAGISISETGIASYDGPAVVTK